MKASELLQRLEDLILAHGDLELVYAVDDEGNDYDSITYPANDCYWDGENYQFDDEKKPTHICIN